MRTLSKIEGGETNGINDGQEDKLLVNLWFSNASFAKAAMDSMLFKCIACFREVVVYLIATMHVNR